MREKKVETSKEKKYYSWKSVLSDSKNLARAKARYGRNPFLGSRKKKKKVFISFPFEIRAREKAACRKGSLAPSVQKEEKVHDFCMYFSSGFVRRYPYILIK